MFSNLVTCFTTASSRFFLSIAVALLISVSILDIRQDARNTSNFHLANIHET